MAMNTNPTVASVPSYPAKLADDGRMHCLARNKDDPYTCPECKAELETSQLYAAHVAFNHYKDETETAKKSRLAARHREKNFRIIKSSQGLTIVPKRNKNKNNNRAPRKVGNNVDNVRAPVKRKQGERSFPRVEGEELLVEIEVQAQYV
ncbi:hypothetical protein ACOSQ4_017533 [Xanthoceras sorbifolium]